MTRFFVLLTLLMAITFLAVQGIWDPPSRPNTQAMILMGTCLVSSYVVMINLMRDGGRPVYRDVDERTVCQDVRQSRFQSATRAVRHPR